MTRLPRLLLVPLALLALGCEETLVEPEVEVSFARGGNPGKPGGDEPPAPESRMGLAIGYDAVITEGRGSGAFSSIKGARTPVGSTVEFSSAVTVVTYLQAQDDLSACFLDPYVLGAWSITNGRAEFSFSALAADGLVSKNYVLTLAGTDASFTEWPVSEGMHSYFMASEWSVTPQGKGKKNPGCEGGGLFASDDSVRVEVRHRRPFLSPSPTTAFLYSPLTVAVPEPAFQLFDHSPGGDGQVVDYRGRLGGSYDGHGAYDWGMPERTSVVAAATGTVVWATTDPPFYCARGGRIVTDQLKVAIEHDQGFTTVYVMLDSMTVAVGDDVSAGDEIGLSGDGETGCASSPYLHFVVRLTDDAGIDFYTRNGGGTDPYGWWAPEDDENLDPWPRLNQWLWRDGEAPPVG